MRSCLLSVFFAVALLLLGGASAFAEGTQRELKGGSSEVVDAMLVLDASGSMLQTDPHRLRDEAAKLFSRFLKSEDRLGIIEFSRTAVVVRPLTPFQKDDVVKAEQAISSIETSGEYTDLLAGIKLAQNELNDNKRPGTSRVIILLSDGKMEPDPTRGSPEAVTNELINMYLPDLKSQGIKIYTVGFSDQADRELLANIALGTEGIHWFAETADKLHQCFAELFLAIKKPQIVPLSGKGFKVDQDVIEVTFYVSRLPGASLELSMPSGKKVNFENKTGDFKWFKSDSFDVVTVQNPEPGDWQVSGVGQEEGFVTILTNLKLQSDWPTSIIAQTPVLLQVRLYDGERPVALPEVSGVTKYAFQVIPTDQVSAPVIRGVLHDDGKEGDKLAGDGIFSSIVEVEQAGDYKLRAVAQSATFTRTQQVPFRVRPPLISMSIENREEDELFDDAASSSDAHQGGGSGEGHAGGEGDGEAAHSDAHAEADAHQAETEAPAGEASQKVEHSNDEAGNSEPPKEDLSVTEDTQSGKESLEVIEGNPYDYIIVDLSDEALQLKNISVRLLAVDKNRTRFSVTLHKVEDKLGRFEASVREIPHEDIYEIQAILTGQTKAKKSVRAQTKMIRYRRPHVGVEQPKVEKPKEEAPKGPPFPWLAVLLPLVLNGGVAYSLFKKLKVASTSQMIIEPKIEPLEHVTAVISELQKKVEITEVDLSAPMFTDPNFKVEVSVMAGGSHPAPEAAPEEVVPEAEEAPPPPPPEETPPTDSSPPAGEGA